jgi:hypothetical protein
MRALTGKELYLIFSGLRFFFSLGLGAILEGSSILQLRQQSG